MRIFIPILFFLVSCASGCGDLPTDPSPGSLPASSDARMSLRSLSLWDRDCSQAIIDNCDGAPTVRPDQHGQYPVTPGGRFQLEIYVNNPRVSFRSISIGATINWEDYDVLIPDVPQREDTYATGVIFRQTSGDFPQTISPTHRIQIRIVETGGDLPEPFIIERELPIRSAE